MADGIWIVLWTALMWTSHSGVEALTIKTVTGYCGSRHKMSDKDVYRVMMPADRNCSSADFMCTFQFNKMSRLNNDYEICVDFSRLRLKGADTRFTISTDPYSNREMLTSTDYPLLGKSWKTRRCFQRRRLEIRFLSDCGGSDNSLRYYFSSWIYVYVQQPKEHVIYLDGTCRCREYLGSEKMSMIVRSIYWRDTAGEPGSQSCRLDVGTVSYDYDSFCTKWNFLHSSCAVTVRFGEIIYSKADYSLSRLYKCGERKENRDTCIAFGPYKKPVFNVVRNEKASDDRTLADGSLFFEVEARIKEKKKNYDSYDNGDDDDDETLSIKIIFPLAFLFSVCCCICGVSRKRAKEEQQESGALTTPLRTLPDGYSGNAEVLSTPTVRQRDASPRRSAYGDREPQPTPPLRPTAHHTPPSREERDRMVAPPPTYADLEFMTPQFRTGSQGGGSSRGATPDASPRHAPASGAEEETIEAPPLISNGLPEAPPAYHELFPSNG